MASTRGTSQNRLTDIPSMAIYRIPRPDYPKDDDDDTLVHCSLNQSQSTNVSDTGTNSSSYSSAHGTIPNERQDSTHSNNSSQATSGYSRVGGVNIIESQRNRHVHDTCTSGSPYDNNIHVPMIGRAVFNDFRNPTGSGPRMATTHPRGCSTLSRHYYVDFDRYGHQIEDNSKSKGICDKMSKAAKIFITTVIITGLALMLTYLANSQRKIDDLNKNVQTQTSSLWSEQSKDSDDFNNTLIKFTEDQREEDEIMSIFINDTQMQLDNISNVTNISLSLSKKSQTSFRVMTDMVEDFSSQTNSSMNEIGNRVDALSSEIQISSKNITNTMETLSNHTKTSSIELKNMLKEQSNQSNTFLEEKMKELLKDLKDELTALIESRIGGGCINNSLNVTTGECVDSCLRVADGDYQSCDTCHGYVTCANNYNFTMKCPETYLIWDDNKKTCESTSETCNPNDFT